MRILFFLFFLCQSLTADTAKPWTRWWWLGSAVDKENLTAQLEDFAAAGLGGVEICPIYGAKGAEDRFLDFLSPEWVEMLAHTSRECERLGLGLDITTGTGWPFGGPQVTPEMASHGLIPLKWEGIQGRFERELEYPPEVLRAYQGKESLDLLPFVNERRLDWTPDEGKWSIYGLSSKSPMQKVKRAAPGGSGYVLDPFSPLSLSQYLLPFDQALNQLDAPQPRAHFHDSFEYYGAEWTPDFLTAFKKQHGYSLADQLPAFFKQGDPRTIAAVHHDYRATLDQLHYNYLAHWNRWAKQHGSLTRNQAHGSPGNLLDHYAIADIPETEIFRHVEDIQIPTLQLATSAAHLTGKTLVSAESFTWLSEHFQVEPKALKEAADFLWLGGVNHIFYHGTPYSPKDAGWPGWLFYASTHMGRNGGLWHDLSAFNGYIERVQRELQSGQPDTSVLLYFPIHEIWSQPSDKLPLLTIHNQNEWLHGTSFHETAMTLWEKGIACDFVSERLLGNLTVNDGKLQAGDLRYKTLLIPDLKSLPGGTANHLVSLRAQGANIVFLGDCPTETPGLGDRFPEALAPLALLPRKVALLPHLAELGIRPEAMAERGIRFVRRQTEEGRSWFLVNKANEVIDEAFELSVPTRHATFIDPTRADHSGSIEVKDNTIRVRLQPGESRILRTSTEDGDQGERWFDLFNPKEEATALENEWKVEFLEGGPVLPKPVTIDALKSWTEFGEDPAYRNFSGTARYDTTFAHDRRGPFILDLGEVAETCRVTLNGRQVGSSFFPPHRFNLLGFLKPGENTLSIEVTNLASNRIADLDRRGVEWKAFHEINFVNIDYQPFDASTWPPLPSGLLGPVRLIQPEMDFRRMRRDDPERMHDPSTIVEEQGNYRCLGTGTGITIHKEEPKSGKWLREGQIFSEGNFPDWHRELVPENGGHLWAPDVIQLGDTYHVYYSVSTFGKQTSAIGLVTGKTLDPNSSDWGWRDEGPVVASTPDSPFNAIDPALFQDEDGSLWMSWGSFWNGLYLQELDPSTGLLLNGKGEPQRVASAQEIEAPFIHKRGEFYYLFLNWGRCCRGMFSTYDIRVGRAKSITGPYLDRDEVDLKDGGGSLVLATEGRCIGPGHASILQRDGQDYLFHHYYDGEKRGRSRGRLAPLKWQDDWPVVDGLPGASNTPKR